MKKLLLAAGDKPLNPSTIDFACYLAKLTKSGLKGLFLETKRHERASVASMEAVGQEGAVRSAKPMQYQQLEAFKDACLSRSVRGEAEGEKLFSWNELIGETRFADAVIIDSDFTMQAHALEAYPSHDAKKLLHEAECPVVVAPLSFERLDEIIFTYDGSAASAYAIRQFLYLFPELRDARVTILEIWSEEEETRRNDIPKLKNWLEHHFSSVDSVLLEGDVQSRLLEYLLSHPYAFVVMGGSGRSRASRIFQPSASGTVVKMVSAPVFIAHP
jgi:nucleotide-binding universal stress UspA family protein